MIVFGCREKVDVSVLTGNNGVFILYTMPEIFLILLIRDIESDYLKILPFYSSVNGFFRGIVCIHVPYPLLW